ncbi:long-chain-acyl-CoA synthetase [Acidisphaera sp. S103]|uniref:long-chain-acyl-CoA synthetase n=1 Tax=Acidisphaera sp. S103 TaxID=1747223 RepID=UPI00131D8C39|nr:long-chain-acyl-CoA synthetase [Acidisphaera sp. S103]
MVSRSAVNDWVRALQYKKQLYASSNTTLLSMIEDLAETRGDALALFGQGGQLTYHGLVERSYCYANWTLTQAIAKGDVVGLLMPNCTDYVAIWLGITQAGCAVALINTNLVGDTLAHAIRVAGANHLIVADSLLKTVTATKLPAGMRVWVHGDGAESNLPRIDRDIGRYGGERTNALRARLPSRRDRALLIYTSGTTGAPKAANVTHERVLEWSFWFAGMTDAQPEDRLYNCLPMYHSTGGVVAIGSMLVVGGSVMIRPRFSVSRFWDEVVSGGCTVFQYIGELCRYLARSEPQPLESTHRLRLCCGNGLRGDVWDEFQSRFRIPRILEFYAATEGHVSLYNCEGKVGAIGRIPAFLAHRFPVEIIRSDIDTGQPLRDDGGFCIRCAIDEPGEAIGQISGGSSSPERQFDGYSDPKASDAKVLRDVFSVGDRWFRTGDLMRKDKAGYYYFVDRIGDTFRWKGENVSTAEVASVVAACKGVIDSVVYGVAIPGKEGRAGMAAITTDESFDFAVLNAHLHANLPAYACPLFIRLCSDIPRTGTFKLMKNSLALEGLYPSMPTDTVWFKDQKVCPGSFVRLASRPDDQLASI